MTKTETNKALALAIWYLPEHVVHTLLDEIYVCRPKNEYELDNPDFDWNHWFAFDYNDPTVILPIAKHYGLSMDYFSTIKLWQVTNKAPNIWKNSESLEEAIALCVIELNKVKP